MHHPRDPEFNEDGDCCAATDWLGQRFAVGDRVMYCVGAGRGQMMAIGRVVKIEATPGRVWDNEVCAYGYRFRVQVLTERTSGCWNNKRRSRPAWVNEMNITALPIPTELT